MCPLPHHRPSRCTACRSPQPQHHRLCPRALSWVSSPPNDLLVSFSTLSYGRGHAIDQHVGQQSPLTAALSVTLANIVPPGSELSARLDTMCGTTYRMREATAASERASRDADRVRLGSAEPAVLPRPAVRGAPRWQA